MHSLFGISLELILFKIFLLLIIHRKGRSILRGTLKSVFPSLLLKLLLQPHNRHHHNITRYKTITELRMVLQLPLLWYYGYHLQDSIILKKLR